MSKGKRIAVTASGIMTIDSYGHIKVNGCDIVEFIAMEMGIGNEVYSTVKFPGTIRVSIEPYPVEDVHVVEDSNDRAGEV